MLFKARGNLSPVSPISANEFFHGKFVQRTSNTKCGDHKKNLTNKNWERYLFPVQKSVCINFKNAKCASILYF